MRGSLARRHVAHDLAEKHGLDLEEARQVLELLEDRRTAAELAILSALSLGQRPVDFARRARDEARKEFGDARGT